MLRLNLLPLLALWILAPTDAPPATDTIDAFWQEATRTVVEGDFDGYAALYHEDAVLVSTFSNDTQPIANALDDWRQYFVDTAEGRMEAGLEFRFTQRLHNETTAHETGMFFYRLHPPGETPEPTYIHFESLLVKDGDEWKWVMEFQKSLATAEEWEAAGS